jgi:hypothetical protein
LGEAKWEAVVTLEQPLHLEGYRQVSPSWLLSRDGDLLVWQMHQQHYSSVNYSTQRQRLFMGPGEKLVLIHPSGLAVFGWRKFIDQSGQQGINNCLFINLGAGLSSTLILEAELLAWERWPHQRLYTYVNPRKVRSSNPGYCYLRAGWQRCGVTKSRRLVILEKEAA